MSFSKMEFQGVGYAKLLLFGEHSAVYGFPAVGLPLPLSLQVTLSPSCSETHWHYEMPDKAFIPFVERLVGKLSEIMPQFGKLSGGTICIDSNIPASVGLGSSAALCVAFIKAASSLFSHLNPSEQQIWTWANQCEGIFHGKPSGIDTGLSLVNRLSAFYPRENGIPDIEIIHGASLFLLLVIFPRTSNTKDLVSNIAHRIERDPIIQRRMSKLGEIAVKAIGQLQQANTHLSSEIGKLASKAHQELDELGLSSTEQNQILELGKEFGATGGKLSGAGGGGATYLIADDREQLDQLSQMMMRSFDLYPSQSKPLIMKIVWEDETSRML